ncbi:MAG: hypothetical protein WCI39_06025 [Gallionellaceae bacterium]
MNKILVVALVSVFASTSVMAEELSVGAAYGLGYNNLDIHADVNISKFANNNPVKARVGYNRYSSDYGAGVTGYTWAYNVFYAGAYYDFNKIAKLDAKVHPFLGLGLGFGSTSCTGNWCGNASAVTAGGLYYIGGVQYDFTPKVQGEIGFGVWSGLSVGANFKY